MKYDYNIVVIGAGAGGLVASQIAKNLKAKVALVEQSKMGGDCLNTGCVPSKAFIKIADIISYKKNVEKYGLKKITIHFEFEQIMEHVQKVIQKIASHDSVERYRSLGVECFEGKAHILDKHHVEINDQVLTTKNIIIATGAHPFVPPIEGIENIRYYTSDNIWSLKIAPKKMLILGAGSIGCELSQAFSRLNIKVTLLERSSHILEREDLDVSNLMEVTLQEDGVTILKNHNPKSFITKDDKTFLVCKTTDGLKSIEFDTVLLALGRRPNCKGLGLENANVKFDDRNCLEINDFLQTNIPNIFVCGDVAGRHQFTHTAANHAYYSVINALFRPFKKFKVQESVIPYVTFTHPQIAQVGINEKQAKLKKITYEVTTFQLNELDRAIIDGFSNGFIKVITTPKKNQILGVTIIGEYAGEVIAEFVLAMKNKLSLRSILQTIHSYPTFSEMNRYVASKHQKKTIPTWVFKFLKKWNKLRR